MFSVTNSKTGRSLFLHSKIGKSTKPLYYFTYEIVGGIDLPEGYEVKYNTKCGHPYILRIGHIKQVSERVLIKRKLKILYRRLYLANNKANKIAEEIHILQDKLKKEEHKNETSNTHSG